jgi:hypothetical protein
VSFCPNVLSPSQQNKYLLNIIVGGLHRNLSGEVAGPISVQYTFYLLYTCLKSNFINNKLDKLVMA